MWGHDVPVFSALLAAGQTGPDLSPLAQYGAIGVFCAALMWFAYRSVKRESDRADRMEAEVARLNQVLRDSEAATRDTVNSMREVISYLQDHAPPRQARKRST